MVTWGSSCQQTDRQTDMTENITFRQIRWRAVTNLRKASTHVVRTLPPLDHHFDRRSLLRPETDTGLLERDH